jgi:alkylation response protein AidB-like acyl-CoA dehydrogenase
MSLVFSDDQEELRRTVRAFLDQKSPEPEVRRLMATVDGYDPEVWSQMAEQLGLQGLAIPEEYGGSGFTWVELGIVLEEMGRRLLCAPFFSTVVLAATTLLESGDDTAKAEWLPGIADGSTIATLAVTEDTGKWTADSVEATATPSGDGFTLSGVKSYVLDGHIADLVLVVARTDAGPSLFAVRGDAAGLVRTPMMTLDETRKQARLELDGTPGVLIGTDGGAAEVLERAYDQIVTGLAAEQMGGAQFCLEQATEYAAVRVQYGRIIGSYQAIKHKLANVLMVVELGKTAAYQAAKCAAETPDELPEAAAMAKSFCSDAYLKAAADNIQVHGGMGFTWEHHSHLYLRRAKSSELLFGEPSEWRARLADTVGIS